MATKYLVEIKLNGPDAPGQMILMDQATFDLYKTGCIQFALNSNIVTQTAPMLNPSHNINEPVADQTNNVQSLNNNNSNQHQSMAIENASLEMESKIETEKIGLHQPLIQPQIEPKMGQPNIEPPKMVENETPIMAELDQPFLENEQVSAMTEAPIIENTTKMLFQDPIHTKIHHLIQDQQETEHNQQNDTFATNSAPELGPSQSDLHTINSQTSENLPNLTETMPLHLPTSPESENVQNTLKSLDFGNSPAMPNLEYAMGQNSLQAKSLDLPDSENNPTNIEEDIVQIPDLNNSLTMPNLEYAMQQNSIQDISPLKMPDSSIPSAIEVLSNNPINVPITAAVRPKRIIKAKTKAQPIVLEAKLPTSRSGRIRKPPRCDCQASDCAYTVYMASINAIKPEVAPLPKKMIKGKKETAKVETMATAPSIIIPALKQAAAIPETSVNQVSLMPPTKGSTRITKNALKTKEVIPSTELNEEIILKEPTEPEIDIILQEAVISAEEILSSNDDQMTVGAMQPLADQYPGKKVQKRKATKKTDQLLAQNEAIDVISDIQAPVVAKKTRKPRKTALVKKESIQMESGILAPLACQSNILPMVKPEAKVKPKAVYVDSDEDELPTFNFLSTASSAPPAPAPSQENALQLVNDPMFHCNLPFAMNGAKRRALSKVGAEYAVSGRSHCRICDGNIKKGELRFSRQILDKNIGGWGGRVIDHWHHARCFWQVFKMRQGSRIDYVEYLEKQDQELIALCMQQLK